MHTQLVTHSFPSCLRLVPERCTVLETLTEEAFKVNQEHHDTRKIFGRENVKFYFIKTRKINNELIHSLMKQP